MAKNSRLKPPDGDNLVTGREYHSLAVDIDSPPTEEFLEPAIGFSDDIYCENGIYLTALSEEIFEQQIDNDHKPEYSRYIREQSIDLIEGLDDSILNIVAEFARAANSASPSERAAMLEAALESRNGPQKPETSRPPENAPKFDFKPGTLKLNTEFQRVASENPWAERDRSVWGRDLSKIVDFLKATYQPWLGRGMSQADLRSVDKGAYQALRNYLKYNELPDDLPLPTLSRANIDRLSFQEDKDHLLAARSYDRYRKSLSMS